MEWFSYWTDGAIAHPVVDLSGLPRFKDLPITIGFDAANHLQKGLKVGLCREFDMAVIAEIGQRYVSHDFQVEKVVTHLHLSGLWTCLRRRLRLH